MNEDNFNKKVNEKIKEILLWWNKLDWTDRELILLEVYNKWEKGK